ncbi:MAG: type II toxin-antitoxin system VapC family toxin [Acidobacteria bacterium]|nr:type II toxin-antitoxin system VapC family toxin [Acidobacteriota bacterium]MBV9071032.1 type II toxin-antitoxin system VapC family toxin [Acidobacteriota bacterium]MBV9188563.1 type II toxin-antitoxin system VapC family toxin [Acidobacteriota bacterium]
MRALVDTNVLVRHLTGDPPAQAKRATAFLGDSHELILTDLVLAEMVYVLESFYEIPRTDIARTARSLLALPSIETGDHELLLRTVEIYEILRLDFAEAYLSALAEMSDVKRVASFDRQIDRVKNIERVER